MMKRLRSVVFWLHLAVGVCAAAVILVMSATGVALTYQRQMQYWADTRGMDGGPPVAGAAALPAAELLAKAAAERPGTPTAIRWRRDTHAPVEIVYGREGTVFVNAYTGAVLGTGAEGMRAFFRSMTDWHRWLARQGDVRERGKAVTGAANLAFLFIVASGFYLWWPRRWNTRALRNVTVFRGGLSPKARDFNWHNVIGFWSLVPLFVVVLSGVVISYKWAGDLVYRAVGEAPPAARSAGAPATRAQNGDKGRSAPDVIDVAAVDALITAAKAHEPRWKIVTMQLAPADDGAVSFTVDRGDGGQPQKRAQLVLAPRTGETVRWEPFSAGTPGRQLRSVLRFAHTGEVLGIPGQTLAGLVTLGSLVLVWTGLTLSLRRLVMWVRRRTTTRTPVTGVRRLDPRASHGARASQAAVPAGARTDPLAPAARGRTRLRRARSA